MVKLQLGFNLYS